MEKKKERTPKWIVTVRRGAESEYRRWREGLAKCEAGRVRDLGTQRQEGRVGMRE